MQSLENHLRQLSEHPGDQESQDIVHDIKHACFQEVLIEQLGLLCSHVFRSDYNLLRYLEISISSKEQKLYTKTRETILIFLSELLTLVKKYNHNISDYIYEIKNTCISLFRKEDGNTVRSGTLLLLERLFHLDLSFVDIEQLQVPQLADLLLNEFAYGKCGPGVKANILKFEGLLLKKFPELVSFKASSFQSLYLDTLKTNFQSNKPDMQMISASLLGINKLLHHFSADFLSNPNNVRLVYRFICMSLEPPPSTTRYHIPKAGLEIISTHSSVFKEYLTEDSEKMFLRLTNMCKHQNKSVMYRGFSALDAFFQSVANELVGSQRSEDSNAKTFQFFFRKFFEIIDSPNALSKEISIAIRGFGKFAGAALRYMGTLELKKICGKLFQFSERFFSGGIDQFDETAHHLHSFISAFAHLMLYMDTIDDVYLDHLEKLISAVFVFYPKLLVKKRQDYNESLSRLFVSLFSKGSALQSLLSRIVFQGLVLSCTNRTEEVAKETPQFNTLADNDQEPPFIAYKELWENIIDPVPISDMELPESKRKELCVIIYSQFVTSILLIVRKLNLGYQVITNVDTEDQALESTDPSADNVSNLVPLVPKDYDIFLNLVDFCKKILLTKNTELFVPWVYLFGKDIIKLSNSYPLVSGFYKFLGIVMTLCEKHHYFDPSKRENTNDEDDEMYIQDNNNETRGVCFELFSKFIKEVLVRIQQYKNELLSSCIQFLLSVAKEFVDVKLLLPALKIAFKIGLSYINLANIGLSALERFIAVSPESVVELLPNILPSLNEYLRMDTQEYEEKITTKLEDKFKFKKKKTKQGVGKFLVKSKALRLQVRVLRFLGRLGGNNNMILNNNLESEKSTELEIVWDTVPRVKFLLPFTELKPELFLDSFLPRIVELSNSAQDRQVKVAACELLHSIILFMIGNSAFKHNNLTQYYKLYEHIFPAIIQLSTDVEVVAKQLFKPLTMQLINWFTRNEKYENTETMKLLDAIINAVGNPNDGALRDFSAKCLTQFLQSSLQYSNSKSDNAEEKNPTNVKSLFKRLYSLARHPDPFKRLGCALTLNQSYKIFREHQKIVDVFIFELLHNAIFSLRLSHNDDGSTGTSEQMSLAIKNLTRIVTVYAKEGKLLSNDKKRRQHSSLADFVTWLFEETKRPERVCRKECMELFVTLAALLPNISSATQWVQRNLKLNSVSWFFEIFEPEELAFRVKETTSYSKILSRFITIEGLIDIYHWILKEDLVDPKLLFDSSLELHSKLFIIINDFFQAGAFLGTNEEILFKVGKNKVTPSFLDTLTPLEFETLNIKKTLLLYQILRFLLLIFNNTSLLKFLKHQSAFEEILSNRRFYNSLFCSILIPSFMGFNMNDQTLKYEDDVLPVLSKLCVTLTEKIAPNQSENLKSSIKSITSNEQLNLANIYNTQFHGSEHNPILQNVQSITSLITGYRILFNTRMLGNYLSEKLKNQENLPEQLCQTIFDSNLAQLTPTQIIIATQILDLCFSMNDDPSIITECLLNQTVLANSTSKIQVSAEPKENVKLTIQQPTKGNLFYTKFSSLIVSHIIHHFDDYVESLMNNAETNPVILQVLNDVIDTTTKQKHPQSDRIEELITNNLHKFKKWYSLTSSPILQYQLLEFLRKFIKLNQFEKELTDKIEFIIAAFASLMDRTIILSFKIEVLDLLPSILLLPVNTLDRVKTALSDTITYCFPVNSIDLPKNSSIFTEVNKTIDKLLHALIISKNPMIIEVLLPVIREEDHVNAVKINSSLVEFTNDLNDEQAINAFNLCYSVFLEESHQDQLRLAIVKKLCIPILSHMSIPTITNLYNNQIIKLMEIINLPASPSSYLETTFIVNKICTYLLIKSMYDLVPAKILREKINTTYFQSQRIGGEAKGNELTTAIMRAAHNAKAKSLADTDIPLSLCNEFHSTAYNALVSVVIATQTKETFFTVFFFKENPEKKEYIWNNIINTEEQFNFEVETKFPLLVDQTEQIKQAKEERAKKTENRVHYISSQYLADTSLSQDMSYMASLYESSQHNFDSAPQSKAANYEEIVIKKSKTDEKNANNNEEVNENEELELDVINNNPCMQSILKLIDSIMKTFGSSYQSLPANQMPGWMKEIHTTLTDPLTAFNVKLFLVKIIINRPTLFEKYSKLFLEPILQICISPAIGKSFNYYLRDVCILLLLKWTHEPRQLTQSEQLSSTHLFSNLIQNLNYQNNRAIWKSNLELIKIFVEKWKTYFNFDIISPSKRIILSLISFEDKNSRDKINLKLQRITGVQLLGILISNDYPLFTASDAAFVGETSYYDLICNNLRQTSKELYSINAEVCGLIMKKEGYQNTTFSKIVKERLHSMLNSLDSIDKSLLCLSKISIHCPEFLDSFFLKLFNILPKLIGEYRIIGLQLILTRASDIDDLLKNIRPIIEKLLTHRDVEAQSLMLQIFIKLLPKLSIVDAERYLNLLTKIFTTNTNERCRELFYDILIWMYENIEEIAENDLLRECLLRGLCDQSDLISKKLVTFWNDPKRLSTNIVDRLMQVMSKTYHPSVESNWIRFSAHFLLQLCQFSPDFNLTLFEPLTDAVQFQEYHIDFSWQNRSMPMSPLFSTQSQQMLQSSQDSMDVEGGVVSSTSTFTRPSQLSPIRKGKKGNEKVAIHFTPTQGSTAAQIDTLNPSSQFAIPTSTFDPSRTKSKLINSPFSYTQSSSQGGSQETASQVVRIPRRFLKSDKIIHPSQVTGNSFTLKAMIDRQKQEHRLKQMRDKRQHNITMFRTYRTGELPDIQIKPKEIILPLQALADRDPFIAKVLFTELFKSIFNSLSKNDKKKRKKQAQELVVDLLSQTSSYCTPFIACLQWICYEDKDLNLDPELVSNTSSQSHNYHTGILLLEKQILAIQNGEIYSNSSEEEKEKIEEDSWGKLIGLYKSLGDEDILLGLYDKLFTTNYTKKAVDDELKGDFKHALLIYENALSYLDNHQDENKIGEREATLWENNRMECLVKLLMWNDLAQNALEEVDQCTDYLWSPEHRVPFLRYYITSHLKQKNLRDSLFHFIDISISSSVPDADSRKEILENDFLPEMSFISLCKEDFDKSRHYISNYYTNFLKKWSTIHPLAVAGRRMILQSLQQVVEVDDFLYFNNNDKNFLKLTPLEDLTNNWKRRFPSIEFSDINAWDDIVTYRSLIFDKLYEKYSNFTSLQNKMDTDEDHPPVKLTNTNTNNSSISFTLSDVKEKLLSERGNLYLSAATAARKQNNLPVAELYLKLSLKSSSSASSKQFSFPFFVSLVKLYSLKAKHESNVDKFVKTLKYIEEKKNEQLIVNNPLNQQRFYVLQADVYSELAKLAQDKPQLFEESKSLKLKENTPADLQLSSKAFHYFKSAIELIRSQAMDNFNQTSVSKSFLKYAIFTDDILKSMEKNGIDIKNKESCANYASIIITNSIDAISLQLARDRFPRLLHLIDQFPQTQKLFKKKLKEVEPWMFIRWIPQMMGLLDKPEGAVILPTLVNIADYYPQAMYFPFKISSEKFTSATLKAVAPLAQRLKNSLVDHFITALESLTHPEHRFKDWTELLKPFVKAKDKSNILKLYKEMYEDLCDTKDKEMGSYNKQFAHSWASIFQSKFGKDGSKLAGMDLKTFLQTIQGFNEKMAKGMSPHGTSKMKVSEFNVWLAEYDQSNQASGVDSRFSAIEIPGQYHGLSIPLLDHHVKISSIDIDMLVMGSLRKPKRLKLRGNDQKDHPFLVKGGEDLRLDQRVQQLFSVMNQIFKSDPSCTRRGLFLPTYQVIPMTSKVGMIEWIDNTKPLKAIIEEEIASEEGVNANEVSIQKIMAAKIHEKWLKKYSNSSKLCDMYDSMFEKASRADCMKKFESQMESVSWGLLRSGVMSLSASPEAYLSIRSRFTRSLAAFSIGSYIIGIGDRHLENFLLNYKDGGLIGIDFGHAFGTATQFLPIPELVPFRLTRQFTNFLLPLDSKGLLNHNMIHCLRALQENKDILLNTMNVFITEPLIDWEKLARRCAREQGADGSTAWFPEEKLKVVMKKLSGYNPAHIIIEELRTSVHGNKQNIIKKLEEIVRGSKKENFRAQIGEKCASVSEQVEALVDLASDPNVLGRMYGGWASWI